MSAQKSKALLFLGCHLNRYSSTVQFILLLVTLLLFMCLYGLCQEIVIYGWFQRRLSVFAASLHFLGCTVCAGTAHFWGSHVPGQNKDEEIGLPVPPSRAPFKVYGGLCILKTLGQLFSNLSMQHINFPTKILLKASLPIVTMVLGVLLENRFYSIYEVTSVLVLTLGIIVFFLGDSFDVPEGTAIGFFCMFMSLVCSALTPMLQEHASAHYHTTSSDMLFSTYLGSFLISIFLTYAVGELYTGIEVLKSQYTPGYLCALVGFCTFAFLGASSSIGITIRFGAVTNGICNSCRKVLSVLISIVAFPSRNAVTISQMAGLSLFAAGLFLRVNGKRGGGESKLTTMTSQSSLETLPEVISP